MRSGAASRPSRGCTGSRARPSCPPREGVSRSGSPRPLQHVDERPALGARQRPALDDPHHVALMRVVVLVVRVQRARAAHDLLVAAVPGGGGAPPRGRLLPPFPAPPPPPP